LQDPNNEISDSSQSTSYKAPNALVDFLLGFFVNAFFWFAVIAIAVGVSSDGKTGEASIGAGLFFIFVALPLAVIGGVPLIIWLSYRLSKNHPHRLLGTIVFYPVLFILLGNWGNFHDWINGTGAVDGKFSEHRILSQPIIFNTIYIPRGEHCSENCEAFLLEGFSSTVTELQADSSSFKHETEQGRPWTATTYKLGQGKECWKVDRGRRRFFVKNGYFDLCTLTVGETKEGSFLQLAGNGLLFRSENDDGSALGISEVRRNGIPQSSQTQNGKWAPKKAAVANIIQDGKIGPEILRWEYGADGCCNGSNYDGIHESGTPFRYTDFMRAITGVKTDRIHASSRSNIDQVFDRLIVALNALPVDRQDVEEYLREMLPYNNDKHANLTDVQHQKFDQIVNLACKVQRPDVVIDEFCLQSMLGYGTALGLPYDRNAK
jgi:hypothetical protein